MLVSPALKRGEKEFQKLVSESRRDGAKTFFVQEPKAPEGYFRTCARFFSDIPQMKKIHFTEQHFPASSNLPLVPARM